MKLRPVGRELIHVEGQLDKQTGMTKLIVFFSPFFEQVYNDTSFERHQIDSKFIQIFIESSQLAQMFNPLNMKRNLLYINNQSVPRCKQFPPRL